MKGINEIIDSFMPDTFPAFEEMDLVEQMDWEDNTIFISLEAAGLVERENDTVCGAQQIYFNDEAEPCSTF